MKKELLIILCILVVIITLGIIFFVDGNNKTQNKTQAQKNTDVQGAAEKQDKNTQSSASAPEKKPDEQGTPPEMVIDPEQPYRAKLTTSEGEIFIRLYPEKTPKTVNNFVYLARKDFYDNTIFHRVIRDFMIQGGDPKGDGTGGPGYIFDDEPFEGEYKKGMVAMANRGPNTNGSQFFIMHGDVDLPKSYVIFGEVDRGLDVVDKIALAEVNESPTGEMSQPVEPVVIEDLEILEE